MERCLGAADLASLVCAIRYDELRLVLKAFPGITIVAPELRDVIPNTVQNAYPQVTETPRATSQAIAACRPTPSSRRCHPFGAPDEGERIGGGEGHRSGRLNLRGGRQPPSLTIARP